MNPSGPIDSTEIAKAEVGVDDGFSTAKMGIEVSHCSASDVTDDDLGSPTSEDLDTLRRVSGPIPWTAYTVAFVELCERFSYYGTTVVFVNFIQKPLPEGSDTGAGFDGQSGALGMGQRASTGLTTCECLLLCFAMLVADKCSQCILGLLDAASWSLSRRCKVGQIPHYPVLHSVCSYWSYDSHHVGYSTSHNPSIRLHCLLLNWLDYNGYGCRWLQVSFVPSLIGHN